MKTNWRATLCCLRLICLLSETRHSAMCATITRKNRWKTVICQMWVRARWQLEKMRSRKLNSLEGPSNAISKADSITTWRLLILLSTLERAPTMGLIPTYKRSSRGSKLVVSQLGEGQLNHYPKRAPSEILRFNTTMEILIYQQVITLGISIRCLRRTLVPRG